VTARFTDRVVFVTGAASGMGRATARRFAAEGAKVFVVDISEPGLRETIDLILQAGGAVEGRACDVAAMEPVRAAVTSAVATFGALDILVNAAGVGRFARFEEIDETDFQRTIGVNLGGIFHTTSAAIPHLVKRPGANIVNIASTASMRGQAYAAVYSASKAGVVNFTRSIALEFASRGVRANCVCPGAVRTPFARNFLIREDFDEHLLAYSRPPVVGRVAEPEDIAAAIAFLASDEARVITGAVLLTDMGTLA